MDSSPYPIPTGLHAIPSHHLDLRPDSEIDHDLVNPPPITSEKNFWFFWHSGYNSMHPYTKRNIRAYYRRFTKSGWTIRVLDRLPSSPLNVANFLDITDPETFPKAFIDGTIGGDYAVQHNSDLVRFPLLLKYGGIYADVGFIQIGNIDKLWTEEIANPESKYEIFSYHMGDADLHGLSNYFLCSKKSNPFFLRCHKLFLALWAENGGRISTDGMHSSPLLKGIPMLGGVDYIIEEDGKVTGPEEAGKLLTDYIAQGQAITMVMGLIDPEDDWNGPQYIADHFYGIHFMPGSQMINEMTNWNGQKAFDLMSLQMPKPGEAESSEQTEAREIVETCLRKSFGFKLAHGIILRFVGVTLGSLWRKFEGSDDVEGSYARCFRYGVVFWEQDEETYRECVEPMVFPVKEPFKRGPLLREK